MNRQTGVSLIEVLVCLLLSAIGLLGLASLQLQALQSTLDSAQRSQAVWLMQDLVERMRASAQADNSDYQVGVSCGSLPRMCAHQMTASGLKSASDCTPAQMALFNLWESNCAYSALAGQEHSLSNSRDALILDSTQAQVFQLSVSGEVMSAEASWLRKAVRQPSADVLPGLSHRQEIFR